MGLKINKVTYDMFATMNYSYNDLERNYNDQKNIAILIKGRQVNLSSLNTGSYRDLAYQGRLKPSEMDKYEKEQFIKESKETFSAQMGLYKFAKEKFEKRTFWQKFFHPFRTRDERESINNLKSSIQKEFGVTDKLFENCEDALNNKNLTEHMEKFEVLTEKGLNNITDILDEPLTEREKQNIKDAEKDLNRKYKLDTIALNKLKKDVDLEPNKGAVSNKVEKQIDAPKKDDLDLN